MQMLIEKKCVVQKAEHYVRTILLCCQCNNDKPASVVEHSQSLPYRPLLQVHCPHSKVPFPLEHFGEFRSSFSLLSHSHSQIVSNLIWKLPLLCLVKLWIFTRCECKYVFCARCLSCHSCHSCLWNKTRWNFPLIKTRKLISTNCFF